MNTSSRPSRTIRPTRRLTTGIRSSSRRLRRHEEAVAQIRLAQQLDPLSPIIGADAAETLLFARRYRESLEESDRTLRLHPGYAVARRIRAQALLKVGRVEEALAEAQAAVDTRTRGDFVGILGASFVTAGRFKEARQLVADLEREATQAPALAFQIATIHFHLGQTDRGFQWLDKAYDGRHGSLMTLMVDPAMEHAWEDPRCVALARMIGLMPAPQ